MEAAEAVRRACINAAERGYEDAGVRGLCPEGRWEAALGAIRALNLDTVIEAARTIGSTPERPHRSG